MTVETSPPPLNIDAEGADQNDTTPSGIAAVSLTTASTPQDSVSATITNDDVHQLQNHLHHAASVVQEEHQQHERELLTEPLGASLYYDASTMASLNPIALAAVNRLRNYRPPPFPLWDSLPVRKRSAVLILLYADRWGDLRVVITMRAAGLRNFSGHAALPGGKADSLEETPYQIARREAYEEIGLPMDDLGVPKPFRIESLCSLPPSLARTQLIVTPCVAFLHADRKTPGSPSPTVEESMIPKLDAREVAAVFTAPFYNFLKAHDLPPQPGHTLPPGKWYDGSWIAWMDMPWRVHNFYVPVNDQKVSKPRRTSLQVKEVGDKVKEEQKQEERFKVWGLTGQILVNAARIAFAEEPEIPHNEIYGDTDIIMKAEADGIFNEVGEQPKKEVEKGSAKM